MHTDLKKRINVNIELMYEKTEKWRQELEQKRETLIANKQDIVETIHKLDAEKNKDIKNTVIEVDKNLNDIFRTLLPQSGAKLEHEYE